jgi:P4 family phage/plasmid primase-like protien
MPRLTSNELAALGGTDAGPELPDSRETVPEADAAVATTPRVLGVTKQQAVEHFEQHVRPLLELDAGLALFPADHPLHPVCLGTAKCHRAADYDPSDCADERGKHAVVYWPERATRDPEVLRAAFTSKGRDGLYHVYNIGVNWAKSGSGRYVTLDEDTPGDLRRYCADHKQPPLPATLGWNTGKGHQWVYELPDGVSVGNRSPFKPNYDIDVRGSGKSSYSITAGSTHRTGVLYELAGPTQQVAAAPGWLVEAVVAAETGGRVVARRGNPALPVGGALTTLLADPPAKGGRNDWLAKVVGHLARKHRGDRDAYDVAVADANSRLAEPLPDAEVAKTADSVWAADLANHPGAVAVTDEQQRPVDLDDALLVERFAVEFRPRWRWTSGLGWLQWDGRVWRERPEPALVGEVRLALMALREAETEKVLQWAEAELAATNQRLRTTTDEREVKSLNADLVAIQKAAARQVEALQVLLRRSKIRDVSELLRGPLLADTAEFDNEHDLLNVGNGVVDLRTGELRPHNPDLLFTKITPVEYHPGARHKDWDKTLQAVPDETRPYLLDRLGQALTGHRVTDEVVLILEGGGSNGKSTVLTAVRESLDDSPTGFARTVPKKVLTARDGEHTTSLTTLRGVRFAPMEELPEGQVLNTERLKDVAGQVHITARKIRQDDVTWRTTHALFVATNHRLRVYATDDGTWRRLARVVFPYHYVSRPSGEGERRKDAGLHERMQGRRQLEAVLATLVASAVGWYERGQRFLPAPHRVVADTEAWRAESDVVVAYATERLRFDPNCAVRTSDLFADLNEWLESQGKSRLAEQTVSERFEKHTLMTSRGVARNRARLSGKTLVARDGEPDRNPPAGAFRGWFGLAFRADNERHGTAADEDGGLF